MPFGWSRHDADRTHSRICKGVPMKTSSTALLSTGVALLALVVGVNAANAAGYTGEVEISGSGIFGQNAGAYAGKTWSFDSFTASPLVFATTSVWGVTASVDGSPIVVPPIDNLEFFSAPSGGLFTFNLTSGDSLSFYGDNVNIGGYLALGTYAAAIDYNFSNQYAGIGTGTVTLSAVPETSTWLMMLAGFASLGALALRPVKQRAAA